MTNSFTLDHYLQVASASIMGSLVTDGWSPLLRLLFLSKLIYQNIQFIVSPIISFWFTAKWNRPHWQYYKCIYQVAVVIWKSVFNLLQNSTNQLDLMFCLPWTMWLALNTCFPFSTDKSSFCRMSRWYCGLPDLMSFKALLQFSTWTLMRQTSMSAFWNIRHHCDTTGSTSMRSKVVAIKSCWIIFFW